LPLVFVLGEEGSWGTCFTIMSLASRVPRKGILTGHFQDGHFHKTWSTSLEPWGSIVQQQIHWSRKWPKILN
jgi:hypothetical protein